jgi:hypothetical protein
MIENNDDRLDRIIGLLERSVFEQKRTYEQIQKFVHAMLEAESEIPESVRRFYNAMHDMHDIKYMYEDVGSLVPQHILRECERLDDRCRQILKKHNIEGGAFEKVRREMASDPENRWDHTRLLDKPKEDGDASGKIE